ESAGLQAASAGMRRRGWNSARAAEGATVRRRQRRAPIPTTWGCTDGDCAVERFTLETAVGSDKRQRRKRRQKAFPSPRDSLSTHPPRDSSPLPDRLPIRFLRWLV